MDFRSGKYGQVLIGASAIAEASEWSANDAADVDSFSVFGGAGRKYAIGGDAQVTGTVSGKWNFDAPVSSLLHAGETYTVKLYRHRSDGPLGRNDGISFSAVIGNIQQSTNPQGAATFSFDYASSGAITKVVA